MDRKDSKISSAEGGERNFIQNLNISGKRHKKVFTIHAILVSKAPITHTYIIIITMV